MDLLTLIDRWRKGDDTVFTPLHTQLSRIIFSLFPCDKIVDGMTPRTNHLAQTTANDLLLSFRSPNWKPGEHGIASVVSFIKTKTRWVSAKNIRKASRSPLMVDQRRLNKKTDEIETRSEDDFPTLENSEDDKHRIRLIREVLFRTFYALGDRDQAVIFVCTIGGMSHRAYGKAIRQDENTIKMWHHRATSRLRQQMGFHAASAPALTDYLRGRVAILPEHISHVRNRRHRATLEQAYGQGGRGLEHWLGTSSQTARHRLWQALVALLNTRTVRRGDPHKKQEELFRLLFGVRRKG